MEDLMPFSDAELKKIYEKHYSEFFTLADCKAIDDHVRAGRPNKNFRPLTEADFSRLRQDLDLIESWYRGQNYCFCPLSPSERLRNSAKISQLVEELLKELGSAPGLHQNVFDMWQFSDAGVFGHIDSGAESIMYALQLLHRGAVRATLRDEGSAQVKAPTRKRDKVFYRTIDDLCAVYRKFWNPGHFTVSVGSNGQGGPSVRFLQSTLKIICNQDFDGQAVKDAVAILRKRKIDLDELPSIYSVRGNGGILA